jgi:hypothetical protein
MPNEQRIVVLKKISARLRELMPIVSRIEREIEEDRVLLPERLWRSRIDEDEEGAVGALQFAWHAIHDAVEHIAEVTGEEPPPQIRKAEIPPPDFVYPTVEEVDEERREYADSILQIRSRASPPSG